jgi:hypothetical protein
MEAVAGPWAIVLLLTIAAVVFVQVLFWVSTTTFPENSQNAVGYKKETKETEATIDLKSNVRVGNPTPTPIEVMMTTNNALPTERFSTPTLNRDTEDLVPLAIPWRCVCENGFLPPGLLKSFGSAEAIVRLGTGQCYHKQT